MSRDRSFDPTLYMRSRDVEPDPIQEAVNELARTLPEVQESFRRDNALRKALAASRRQAREAERASRSTDAPVTPKAVRLDHVVLRACTGWIEGRLPLVERLEALRRDGRANRPGDDAESWERELGAIVEEAAGDLVTAPAGLTESLAMIREAMATRGELRECLGIRGPSAHENVSRWLESVIAAWERSYWVEDRLTDAEVAMRRADHGNWFMRTFHTTSRSELGEVADLLRMEQAMAFERLKQSRPNLKRTSRGRDETFRADVTKAESIVRGSNDVFPGINELARRLRCGKSKLKRIMAASAYLRQCEEATGKRDAKPKELSFEPGVLDALSQERARSAELRECVADQRMDAKKDRITLKRVRPL